MRTEQLTNGLSPAKGNSRHIVDGTKGVGQLAHVFYFGQQEIGVLQFNIIQEIKFCFEGRGKLNSSKLEKEGRNEMLYIFSHLSPPISTFYLGPGNPPPYPGLETFIFFFFHLTGTWFS